MGSKNGILRLKKLPMTKSITARATTFLLRELLGEVLFFPVWWYSVGLRRWSWGLLNQLAAAEYRLGLRPLLKNIWQPMYGDRTRSGRIISFFMRLVLIIGKGFTLVVWAVVVMAGWLLWIIAPLATLGLLFRQLIPNA